MGPGTPSVWPVSFQDVLEARDRIRPFLPKTPLRSYASLDETVGRDIRVFVKHENHNPTNSFKARNGMSLLSALAEEARRRGVVAATRGNHGLGLAWAGSLLGARVTICVPVGNSPEKNEAMRGYGVELIEQGRDYDEVVRVADALRGQRGLRLAHSTNDPLVIAGAGTLTLEILPAGPRRRVVVFRGVNSLACSLPLAMHSNNPILLPGSFVCRDGPGRGPEARVRMTRKKTSRAKTRESARHEPRGSAAPGAERGGNGGQGHGSRAGTAQGEIGFESVGAAFLVVDRAGWVLRSNGWEEVLQAPTPARIPAADEEPNALIEGVTATIDDARRLAGPARRIVSLELERQRFYTVSAGPIGGKGEGATAALVLEITELFSLGPREGDAIRQLAHDLRTPLTSMSGAVELLESGRLGHLTPEQVRLLEMLGKGMQMMLSLLDDASARAKSAQDAGSRGRATA